MSLNALWILGVIYLTKNLITGLISEKAGFDFILTVGDIKNTLAIYIIHGTALRCYTNSPLFCRIS